MIRPEAAFHLIKTILAELPYFVNCRTGSPRGEAYTQLHTLDAVWGYRQPPPYHIRLLAKAHNYSIDKAHNKKYIHIFSYFAQLRFFHPKFVMGCTDLISMELQLGSTRSHSCA